MPACSPSAFELLGNARWVGPPCAILEGIVVLASLAPRFIKQLNNEIQLASRLQYSFSILLFYPKLFCAPVASASTQQIHEQKSWSYKLGASVLLVFDFHAIEHISSLAICAVDALHIVASHLDPQNVLDLLMQYTFISTYSCKHFF